MNFKSLENLKCLSINSNHIQKLPPFFYSLNTLTQLCLVDNDIEELPTDISGLANLELLNVMRNKLTALPSESFASLTKIKKLKLDHNRFREVRA